MISLRIFRQTALVFIQKSRQRIRSGFAVMHALWKSGIPVRFSLFLGALGLIAGVGAKTLAERSFTIGHDDYRLAPAERLYDLNAVQERVLEKGGVLTEPAASSSYPSEPIDTGTGN